MSTTNAIPTIEAAAGSTAGEAEASVNPAVQFALDRLCSRESKATEASLDEKNDRESRQSRKSSEMSSDDESQCVKMNNKSTSTLQSLSPNELQLSPGRMRYRPQSTRFRPISLLVKRSSSSSEDEEDQATFEDCFFDLLFSASLSVYGSAANLTSFNDVGQFMSFFTLLWWSWWCQTIYDVRYRSRHHSSLFSVCAHRAIRIFLLGTWVAFSTCASEYSRGVYTNFTLVYTLTRAALLADHLVSAFDPPPPRHTVRDKTQKRSSRFFCHFISMAAITFSLLCWSASHYLTSKRIDVVMTPVVFALWTVSVFTEVASQVFVEIYGPFECLSSTHLVERLALFSLIIYGGGYENIGLALNAISPREATKTSSSTGWRFGTVLNAISAVAIIMLLFFGYFKKAVKRLHGSPIVVLSWSYLHVVLHIASAVVVIGLSRLISFSNTAEALKDFDLHPWAYLPHTVEWRDYVKAHFPTLVGFESIPNLNTITNPLEYQVASVQLSILATQGAIIPSTLQATLLVNSTKTFQGVDWPAALQTQLSSYYGLLSSTRDPNSGSEFVRNNLFQFYYCYATVGIYMLTDVALKYVQGMGEHSEHARSRLWS
ncbi:hypothetical protein CBS101457_002254 [Exobasidium rhododendri]|nr:hypothetical protein CBS101457_002254 [Exobasidium rhododendri]